MSTKCIISQIACSSLSFDYQHPALLIFLRKGIYLQHYRRIHSPTHALMNTKSTPAQAWGYKSYCCPTCADYRFSQIKPPRGQRPQDPFANPGIRHFEPTQKCYSGFSATLCNHQSLKIGWLWKVRVRNGCFKKEGWYGGRHRKPWQFTIKISD